MTNAYLDEAAGFGRVCLSSWNRDPASPSFGCFDRSYWGWKKKDLPDATFQVAIVLALRMARRAGRDGAHQPMVGPYVAFLRRIQHSYGGFDQIYPHERAPGVVHDILSSLVWLWRSPYPDATAKAGLEEIMRRAVDYALVSDEKHGEIANHFAQYAWELVNYGHAFDDRRASEYGRRYLDRTLALFNEEEGWFREYDGADAGYQTRCVAFLARIAELTGDAALWEVLHKAAGFLDRMTMPDGSLHPMLGVRSTALTYVSGFERIAERFPEFAALADRIHDGWASGAGMPPSSLDFENGLRIADDAWEAAEIRERRLAAQATAPAPATRSFDMPAAGLHRRTVEGDGRARQIDVATRLGGVVVAYERDAAGNARLADEDSGYLLALADGSRWVMRHAGSGDGISVSETKISVTAAFTRALHEDLSPPQMILLRVLNLTVLRSQFLGDIFKKLVVRRLISGRSKLDLVCRRRIRMEGDGVVIEDRFEVGPALRGRLDDARLMRCRRTIANHMASSRYFQPQELDGSRPWIEELPLEAVDGRVISRTVG